MFPRLELIAFVKDLLSSHFALNLLKILLTLTDSGAQDRVLVDGRLWDPTVMDFFFSQTPA